MRKDDYLSVCKKLSQSGVAIDYCLSSNVDEKYRKIYNYKGGNGIVTLLGDYPQKKQKAISKKIKAKFKLENIVLGSGSEDLIIRCNRIIKNQHWKIGVVLPTFYRILETLNDYSLRLLKQDDLDKLPNLVAVWLNNPNPLTGEVIKREYLLKIFAKYPKTIFFIDEAAMFLLSDWKKYSLLIDISKCKNCVVLTSFSKLYGISGLRAGFASGNARIINEIAIYGTTFPFTGLTAYFVDKLLDYDHIFSGIRLQIRKNKGKLEKFLTEKLDLEVRPSQTNCVFCRRKNGAKFYNELLGVGIVSLNLDTQKGIKKQGWVRLTAHSSNVLHNQLISSLQKLLALR